MSSTGFVKPTAGTVELRGRDITGIAPHRAVNLGIARSFQMARPFYNMPVYKNVVIGVYSPRSRKHLGSEFGDRDEAALHLLEEVELPLSSVLARMEARGVRLDVEYLHEMGEPFLYKRLPEAIDLFPGVCVSTNATLLTEEWAKKVLETSLSKIRLCIDTLKPDVYPIVRKGGKFDVVVENIRRFLEMLEGVLVQDIKLEDASGLLAARYAPERYQEFRSE